MYGVLLIIFIILLVITFRFCFWRSSMVVEVILIVLSIFHVCVCVYIFSADWHWLFTDLLQFWSLFYGESNGILMYWYCFCFCYCYDCSDMNGFFANIFLLWTYGLQTLCYAIFFVCLELWFFIASLIFICYRLIYRSIRYE